MSKTANPAVVLGLSSNGLGIVRSLHAADVPVIAVDRPPDGVRDAHRWMSAKTRLCRKVFFRQQGSEALLECLLALGRTLQEKGVLFPSGDNELLCVSRHREALAPYYHFRVPEPSVVELLADKSRFHPFAEGLGLAAPKTVLNATAANIDGIAADMSYPCIIKPYIRDDAWNRLFPTHKAFAAESPQKLVAMFHEIKSRYQDFLIQEVIPGPDSHLYFSHVYLAEDCRTLALWTGHKIRQGPIHFGTSTLAETAWVEEVASASLALLQELNCVGYSSIEFKKDPRDGRYKVMEVTPGRTWYPHFLGFGAGVNIPWIWYQDVLGADPDPADRATEGVRWIDEYRDVFSSYSYWRHGELSLRDWLRSFRAPKVYAYASWRDPLPIIAVIARLILAAPLRLAAWLRRRTGGAAQESRG